MEELLEQNDICIAIKERLTKDSGVAAESSYDNIVKKLATKQNAKGSFVYLGCVCLSVCLFVCATNINRKRNFILLTGSAYCKQLLFSSFFITLPILALPSPIFHTFELLERQLMQNYSQQIHRTVYETLIFILLDR